MKHAFCVLAHADPYCLESLIGLLDYEGNDIYLHMDKKSPVSLERGLATRRSGLHIIPVGSRIDVNWGGLSQVKAEILLFKTALSNGVYDYIHLVSGADLPLKSQKELHEFFSSKTPGSNFVAFSEGEEIKKNVDFKTRFYHLFVEKQRYRRDGNVWHLVQDFSAKFIRKAFLALQKAIGYRREWKDLEIKKGSQWVTVSADFAKYLVEKEEYILKKFRGVICADEIFLQTMLFNSPFASSIVNDNLRKIDWTRGAPYVWHKEDSQELMDSDALFARKFSSQTDSEIINEIKNRSGII